LDQDETMNYYEVLGLPRDASPEEIRHAHAAKAMQLLPARASGAPPDVIEAVTKARTVIDEAGRILGDPVLRAQYDSTVDGSAAHPEAVPRPNDGSTDSGLAGPQVSPSEELANPIYDPLGGLEKLAEWLGPHPRGSRMVTVPDVRGVVASKAFYVVAMAELHINFVRLTERPDGDGLVVGQDPPPGSSVHRHSTLTVEVVYSTEPQVP
jgi:hypothetical protein